MPRLKLLFADAERAQRLAQLYDRIEKATATPDDQVVYEDIADGRLLQRLAPRLFKNPFTNRIEPRTLILAVSGDGAVITLEKCAESGARLI